MPTVLVTDANRGSSIAIIRSLSRHGWRAIAADDHKNSLGFRSRYAAHKVVYPSPARDAGAFVESILAAVVEENVDLVIPTTDDAILPLAHQRERFKGHCRLAIARNEALLTACNKMETVTLAQEVGVPTPQTYLANTIEQALDVAHLLPWPVVLKSIRSRCLTGDGRVVSLGRVGYANDVQDLVREARRLQPYGPTILQAYHGGRGEGVEMLAYEGQPLLAFQHRRLAEIPVTGGASAWRKSVDLDDELFDYSRRLVEALRWTGLIMVEFKVNDFKKTLMEINGRVWGSLPLAIHSGVDFPAALADLYACGPPAAGPVNAGYKVGVDAWNLELMMLWIAQVAAGRWRHKFIPRPRRRDALKALFGLFGRRCRFDVQSLSDPLPGFLEIVHTMQKLARKATADKD